MAYSILITETAKRQLARIDRQMAKRIDRKLHEISQDPFLYVTRLEGVELYKLRVGDYRVLMTIQKAALIIVMVEIGHGVMCTNRPVYIEKRYKGRILPPYIFSLRIYKFHLQRIYR